MCKVRSTQLVFKEVIVASCLSRDIFNPLKMDTLFQGTSLLMVIIANHSLFLGGFVSFPVESFVDANVVTSEGLGFLNSTR